MAMQARQAAYAYTRVGLQTGTLGASPHQLIVMLFDGTQAALKKARGAIDRGDTQARGTALSKAIDIIERGLRAALDFERGGELTPQLDALYDYMIRTLMRANLHGDAALVSEVETLLGNISSAWRQIGDTPRA